VQCRAVRAGRATQIKTWRSTRRRKSSVRSLISSFVNSFIQNSFLHVLINCLGLNRGDDGSGYLFVWMEWRPAG